MNLDQSRKFDLEELYKIYKKEPSTHWRQKVEKTMNDIIHQSKGSRELRDKLIKAVRVGDHRAFKYYENKLLLLKQEHEHGRQF